MCKLRFKRSCCPIQACRSAAGADAGSPGGTMLRHHFAHLLRLVHVPPPRSPVPHRGYQWCRAAQEPQGAPGLSLVRQPGAGRACCSTLGPPGSPGGLGPGTSVSLCRRSRGRSAGWTMCAWSSTPSTARTWCSPGYSKVGAFAGGVRTTRVPATHWLGVRLLPNDLHCAQRAQRREALQHRCPSKGWRPGCVAHSSKASGLAITTHPLHCRQGAGQRQAGAQVRHPGGRHRQRAGAGAASSLGGRLQAACRCMHVMQSACVCRLAYY